MRFGSDSFGGNCAGAMRLPAVTWHNSQIGLLAVLTGNILRVLSSNLKFLLFGDCWFDVCYNKEFFSLIFFADVVRKGIGRL